MSPRVGPRRVLLVQKYAGLGGAQMSLVQHLEHLNRSLFEPHVVLAAKGWLTDQLDKLRVPWSIERFTHWNLPSLPRNLLLVLRLARFIRQHEIDLVHANEHWIAPPCYWAAWLAGVPAICHFRTGLEDLTPHRVRKYLYARFDRVLPVAQVLQRALAQQVPDPRKVLVVRDGVESPAGSPRYRQRQGRRIVINVGAIRRFKGQRTVLEKALPWLKANRRRYLIIVGGVAEESYAQSVKALVSEHGLARQVLLLGSREDVPRLLSMADALIAYSSLEGVPRVVMEAMLAGRPVIVSNTPGMDEVVADGEVGRIVNFDDQSNPVSAALGELSLDLPRWQAMGRRAHEIAASRYSTRAMSEQIQAIYNDLLSEKPRH